MQLQTHTIRMCFVTASLYAWRASNLGLTALERSWWANAAFVPTAKGVIIISRWEADLRSPTTERLDHVLANGTAVKGLWSEAAENWDGSMGAGSIALPALTRRLGGLSRPAQPCEPL